MQEGGSIQFNNGQVILAPRTTIEYPINNHCPTKDFIVQISLLDKMDTHFEFVLGTLSNPGTSLTIDPLVIALSLLYDFDLSLGDIFSQVEDYHRHAAFKS